MAEFNEKTESSIRRELELIWAGHRAVGLEGGVMCIFAHPDKDPWVAREKDFYMWFSEDESDLVIEKIKKYYNNGKLPNTPLLLNPIVFSRGDDENPPEPLGSGVYWSTSPAQGVSRAAEDNLSRARDIGLFAGYIKRGEVPNSGVKTLGFSNRLLTPMDGMSVPGNREIYDFVSVEAEEYSRFYIFSGLFYLSRHGSYCSESLTSMGLPMEGDADEFVRSHQVDIRLIMDAAHCWIGYDRHHSLYEKFGIDPDNLEHNLKIYELCARDVKFFDSTGPMKGERGQQNEFEFIVPGYIPKGAVTVLAAAGGCGKSSVAHYLCVKAATDYAPGDPKPDWLGQPINTDICNGLSIYFSGEDGPAIVNSRTKLFDPENKSRRLMFLRTDFGEGVSFSQFLRRLHKLPDVPVMVIDPARKYLEGNEDDSDVVSKFFEAIEEFAIERHAAVLVVHHLAKHSKPKSAMEVLECLRGSQVFIDRPRVVIGMYRDGPFTCVGLAKTNIPPSMGMVLEERVFVRDPKSLTLVRVQGEKGVRRTELTAEELERIASGEEG